MIYTMTCTLHFRMLNRLLSPIFSLSLSFFFFQRAWIHEDIPSFDYGGAVVGEAEETATLYARHLNI